MLKRLKKLGSLGVFITLLVLPLKSWGSSPQKVLMIINDDFWAPEYYEPRAIFERAGFQITVAGKHLGRVYPDVRNRKQYGPVNVDLSYNQIEPAHFDAITFAGGNGAWTDYFPSETIHKILLQALNSNQIVGLLCASTGLLGVAQNFDGRQKPVAFRRHVTGYYKVEGLLRQLGKVNYDPGTKDRPYVVVDRNLITGRDPMSSRLFGEIVAKQLRSLPVSLNRHFTAYR